MKVIVDEKIPYIKGIIEQLADEVVYASGKAFTPELIKDADALIVRTRTRCDAALLGGSRVSFIATATIGYDHIDIDYCRRKGIVWANAPGCNANSVVEYIESCLLLLRDKYHLSFELLSIGIVGVGHVGGGVAEMARKYGMRVLLNDPPRAEAEGSQDFSPIEELAASCHIITFHTPLTHSNAYATFHLAGESFFASLKKKPIIINTSRGEVVDTGALFRALEDGMVTDAVIDVWEHEPNPDRRLLQRAYITTPHIAGYSADGKANATRMALKALCRHFKIEASFDVELPAPSIPIRTTDVPLSLLAYNPLFDSEALKENPELFEEFRNDYPLRRETAYYRSCGLIGFAD